MRTPSLADAEWLNSPPLGPDDLHGHVVLYDFWTHTCINDYAVWKAFDNHYWPALYLADLEGVIRDHHFGEGEYDASERSIQRLLAVRRPLSRVEPVGVEVAADWNQLRTPETYLGYARGEHFASAGEAEFGRRHLYTYAQYLHFNHWALDGEWTVGSENVTLDEPGGGMAFRFQARDANLVLDRAGGEPIPFQVTLDGAPPGDSAGLHIDADGAGVLDEGGLYQLIRQPGEVGERFLEITFAAPGARAYVFTFG